MIALWQREGIETWCLRDISVDRRWSTRTWVPTAGGQVAVLLCLEEILNLSV